jgi:hypothetical protein
LQHGAAEAPEIPDSETLKISLQEIYLASITRGVKVVKRFTISLAAIFYLLLIAPSWHPATAKDTWTSVHSKNFLLIGNAGEKEIKAAHGSLRESADNRVYDRCRPQD